jgi:hypothetical protein
MNTEWIVSRRDDSHPLIVTLGHPARVMDLFRVVGVHRTGHEGLNSCFTDVRTAVGLARLIEGGVASMADIEGAESGLQALMWHDRISIIVPGFKYRQGDIVSYARAEEPRSDLAFELFKPCEPFDETYATEEVRIEDGHIVSSSYAQSSIVGLDFGKAIREYLSLTPVQAAAISSIPAKLGAPAYFSDPLVERFTGKRGFFGEFYKAVRREWDDATAVVPDVDFSVSLPPLVSIVLDRASDRDSIPQAVHEVRDELAPVREEMLRFSETLRFGAYDQRQVEARCRELKESFQAVVRASRKPHRPLVLTLLQLYSAVKSPIDLLLKHLNPEYRPEDPRLLARRTVTGRTFSTLLATDSMYSLLAHFFSPAEVRALEASRRLEQQ